MQLYTLPPHKRTQSHTVFDVVEALGGLEEKMKWERRCCRMVTWQGKRKETRHGMMDGGELHNTPDYRQWYSAFFWGFFWEWNCYSYRIYNLQCKLLLSVLMIQTKFHKWVVKYQRISRLLFYLLLWEFQGLRCLHYLLKKKTRTTFFSCAVAWYHTVFNYQACGAVSNPCQPGSCSWRSCCVWEGSAVSEWAASCWVLPGHKAGQPLVGFPTQPADPHCPKIVQSSVYLILCKTDQLHTKTVCGFWA